MCQLTCVDFLEWSATQIGFSLIFLILRKLCFCIWWLIGGVLPNKFCQRAFQTQWLLFTRWLKKLEQISYSCFKLRQLTCVDFIEWSATQIGFTLLFHIFTNLGIWWLTGGVFLNELVKELSQHIGNCLPDD